MHVTVNKKLREDFTLMHVVLSWCNPLRRRAEALMRDDTVGSTPLCNVPEKQNGVSDPQTASAPVSNRVVNALGFADFTSERTEKSRKTLLVLTASDGTNLVKLLDATRTTLYPEMESIMGSKHNERRAIETHS
ncbi:Endoribonuclease YbeY, partial [Clarias magur]